MLMPRSLFAILASALIVNAAIAACTPITGLLRELSSMSPAQPTAAPIVLPPGPSPTPLICTPNPYGMTFAAVVKPEPQDSSQRVQIEGKGFAPNEKVLIVVEGHATYHSVRYERFDTPVSPDGVLNTSLSLQVDESPMKWDLFVIHKRGVACLNFVTN